MTRHFLNGLWGSSSFCPLVFFSLSLYGLYGGKCNDDETTKRNKTKEDGETQVESFIIGLDVFFNDFIDRVILPPQQQRI